MYIVYCHTNSKNDKKYVGFTIVREQTPIEAMLTRWGRHCCLARNNSNLLFHRAIRKYGKEQFHHEILETVTTKKAACYAEVSWINKLKTSILRKDDGYNMTLGGDGGTTYLHNHLTKQNLSKMMCGENNPNAKLSSDDIIKIQHLYMFTDHTQKDIALMFNIHQVTISNIINNKSWMNIKRNLFVRQQEKLVETNNVAHNAKSVMQIDDNGIVIAIHKSLNNAGAVVGACSSANISSCCSGKRPRAYGYRWVYMIASMKIGEKILEKSNDKIRK